MPTKNEPLEMGCGMLYMKTPDGQQVQLGYAMAEITPADEPQPVETEMGYINPAPPLPEISIELAPGPGFDEWIKSVQTAYMADLLDKAAKAAKDCMKWAAENHPEWCHILRTTKKKRTRKKYAQRIMREYVAALHAAADLTAGIMTPNEARRLMGLPPV